MQEFEHLWKRYEGEERPQILKALDISHDGGLSTSTLEKLWQGPEEKLRRIFGALQVVFFVLCNTYFILRLDADVLAGDPLYAPPGEGSFLLGRVVWSALCRGSLRAGLELRGEQLVVIVELVLLAVMCCRCLLLVVRAICAGKEWIRWQCVAKLVWCLLPRFYTFSSMKLLHFVSPRVLMTEFFLEFAFTGERCRGGQYLRATRKFAWFLLSRLLCLFVGFDAFLVKLRVTSRVVDGHALTFKRLLPGVVFMFQVLGIVNLAIFARQRLFVFIFGGEDGVLSTREKAREYLWNALLAKRLWQAFPRGQWVLIILSLDDYDFQTLMLREARPSQRVSME